MDGDSRGVCRESVMAGFKSLSGQNDFIIKLMLKAKFTEARW